MLAHLCIFTALPTLAGAVDLSEKQHADLQASSLESAARAETNINLEQHQGLFLASGFWNMFGPLPDNAPEWCMSEKNLSWQEQRRRVEQHATLLWAKGAVRDARAKNETVPEWMDKMVERDTKQGLMKWAVKEAKHLKAVGQEVPQWMADLVQEDSKWADRWAACKTAEVQFAGETPPEWMVENGRRGVLAAANEKLAELQERIDELEALKEKEVALISTHGDIKLAERRLLMSHRKASRMVAPSKNILNLAKRHMAAPRTRVSVKKAEHTAAPPTPVSVKNANMRKAP